MKLLSVLPAAVAGLLAESQFEGMKTVLIDIARKAELSGEKIDQGTKDTVQAMLDNINGTLVGLLHDDRDCAQGDLDTAKDAVEQCLTTRTSTFDTTISGLAGDSSSAKSAFDSCKDGQGGALLQHKSHKSRKHKDVPPTEVTDPWEPMVDGAHDYGYNWTRHWNTEGSQDALGNTSHESHAQSTATRLCNELDQYVQAFVITRDQVESWSEDADVVNDWFTELNLWQSTHAEIYKEKRRKCHEARHRHQMRVEECHRLQHAFESDYCTWANTIDETCSTYSTCYGGAKSAYDTTEGATRDIETQMKNQQHALEHILCYGAQILADSTDLAACNALECSKCSDLDISYPPPHTEVTCSENVETVGVNRPCDSTWCSNNYGAYADSLVPVDECVACPAPVSN